jgi:hypothetical protein
MVFEKRQVCATVPQRKDGVAQPLKYASRYVERVGVREYCGTCVENRTLGSLLVVAPFENLTYLLYCTSVEASHGIACSLKEEAMQGTHLCSEVYCSWPSSNRKVSSIISDHKGMIIVSGHPVPRMLLSGVVGYLV